MKNVRAAAAAAMSAVESSVAASAAASAARRGDAVRQSPHDTWQQSYRAWRAHLASFLRAVSDLVDLLRLRKHRSTQAEARRQWRRDKQMHTRLVCKWRRSRHQSM